MATPQKPGSPSGGWGAAGGGGGKPATPHDPALLAALQQQAGGGSLAFAPYAEEAPFLGGGGGPSLDGSGGAGFDGGAAAAAGAPAPQMDESANEEVMHYLAVLAEYQLLSEKAGNYEECARVTDTVAALRQQEEGRRVQALKARHVSERASVAAAQTQQFKDFNASWDRYLSEYDAMATLYVQQMQEKQLLKLRAQQEALHGELVKKPVKFGREVIEWRGREAVLVKHHKYSEAARIKAVVEELERRERARIDEERLVVFSQREANFRLHQRAELEALLKRVGSRRDEHTKQRALDSARLLQRNKNVMTVLEGRQAAEERERINEIRASFAVIRPPGQDATKSKINTGRVKEKAASYGDALSPADVMKERMAQRKAAASASKR